MDPRQPPHGGTTIKGASLIARLDYVRDKGGDELLRRVLQQLAADDRPIFEGKILPSARFPLELNGRLDDAIARALSPTQRIAVYRDLGRWSAEKNLTTMHAIFLQTGATGGGPHQILERFPSVRATYYSDGAASYERTSATSATLRVAGASSHTQADCESTAGYFERAIALLGGKSPRVDLKRCRSRGDAACELHCTWR